jgi:hypothetical protein
MAAPATPADVVHNLSELTGVLRSKTNAYRTAEADMARKRHAADMAEARAYLRAEGTIEDKKRTAKLSAELEEGPALVAEALVRVLKYEIREIQTLIDIGRTYSANIRAELQTLGYDPTP